MGGGQKLNEDGTSTAWDYLDGWAVRKPGAVPNPIFNAAQWTFSGLDANDGQDNNDSTSKPLPINTPALPLGVLGGADESPMLGQDVRIQAGVTQVMPTLGGYYVQEEGADADADASSWEGIFVRGPFEGIDAGGLVTVEGRVSEVGGETSITAARATVDGVAELPKATLVTFPTATVLRAITLPTLKPMRACLSRYSTNDRGRAVPD
ncbi:hypothetical protein [Falsirhodobacter deserti]|uniref:hypothetical protein n=1 Tax=Falsirhodobacter deserti TaxID=1365611 RepID=UPI000FE3AC11|nr:hypothetical protein [Falsirhodobacter deserti]